MRERERAADEMHETDSSALLSCTHKPSHATQLITTSVNIASTWVNIVNRRVNIVVVWAHGQWGEYCEQKQTGEYWHGALTNIAGCAAMTANLTRRIRSTPTNVSN